MANKHHHNGGTSQRNGARPQYQAEPESGVLESMKDKVVTGFEQGKDAVSDLTDAVTQKLGNELEVAKTAVHDASQKAEQLLQSGEQAMASAGRAMLDAVKENPLPIALTGVGATWLLVNLFTKRGSLSGDAMSSRAPTSTSGASTGALNAAGLGRMVTDNPLAAGAVVFAVGAAVGLAIPRTSLENGWFGTGRDRVVHKVQDVARGALDKVESVAQAVTGSSTHSTKNEERGA